MCTAIQEMFSLKAPSIEDRLHENTGKAGILTSSSGVGAECLISGRERIQVHIQLEDPP